LDIEANPGIARLVKLDAEGITDAEDRDVDLRLA
jgi:hypothetical protein